MTSTRRAFLARSSAAGVLSLGATVPAFLQRAAWAAGEESSRDPDGRILVLVELAGGNDGLNTVVPYADDAYHRARPGVGIDAGAVLKLDDYHGLHPAMTGLKELHDAGSLGVLQGIGYPNPDRSHFRSMDIWHSARPGDEEFRGDGWLGRALDATESSHSGRLPALAVGSNRLPRALVAHQVNVPLLRSLEAFQWHPGTGSDADRRERREVLDRIVGTPAPDGSHLAFLRQSAATAALTARRLGELDPNAPTAASYPANGLGQKLKTVAQLITADLGTRIFFVSLGGFDTHSQQAGSHAALLTELSTALKAFHDDLAANHLGERVLTVTFSEFGRRVEENGSLGTDHGTASQMFVMRPGGPRRAGLIGNHPSFSDLDEEGDLRFHTDFRSVYATLLDQWLALPSEPVLGEKFAPLDFI